MDDPALLAGLPTSWKRLAGSHPLCHLATFADERAWRDARNEIARVCRAKYGDAGSQHYWWQSPVRALQFRSGITFFKEMDFGEVKTLSLDIETFTANGKYFSDANDPADQVIIISVCSNLDQQWLLTLSDGDELRLLQQLNELIAQQDPDVICGHNLLGFDLPYLHQRAERLGLALRWGRDGSELFSRAAKRGWGEQEWTAAGRHLVDTLPALMQYDFTARSLPNYQLKTAVAQLGLAADRSDFDRARISELWSSDRERLLSYARADAQDTLLLYQFLLPQAFFQTRFLPFTYQEVCALGTGTKVDSLLTRNYLLQGHGLPRKGSGEGTLDSGGLTDVLQLGWVEGVAKADAASLYPSICLTYRIQPRQDYLGQFLSTLGALTKQRLQAKRELRQLPKDSLQYRALDAWQSSLKILINSYYGMLGTGGLHFSDPGAASAITSRGQTILRKMVDDVTQSGGVPIEIDTDGIYFVPPVHWADRPASFVSEVLNAGQDEGITIEFDGSFRAMYSYAIKNYLLVDGEQLVRKGTVFRSRRLYGLQDQLIPQIGQLLAANQLAALAELLKQVRRRVLAGELTLEEVCTHAPVRSDLATYPERLRRGGSRNRAYDLIIHRPDLAKWVERSRIVYYHRRGGALALAEEFCGDYDRRHYVELMERTFEKFQYAFPPEVYRALLTGTTTTAELSTWNFPSASDVKRQYEAGSHGQELMLSFLDPPPD